MLPLSHSIKVSLVIFEPLNKRIVATLRQSFIVGYSNTLKRVRKCSKGLKTPFFFVILLVGDNPTAPTLTQLSNIAGLKTANVYNRLIKAIKAGYVYKENKKYYLTGAGRKAYEAMCREYDVAMKEISRHIIEDYLRRQSANQGNDLDRLK